MSYQMKLDEMQEALSRAGHPQAEAFERALCAIGDAMADALAVQFDLCNGSTEQHGVGFAGICCPFNPSHRGQPLPDALADFDDADAWESDADDLPAAPETEEA